MSKEKYQFDEKVVPIADRPPSLLDDKASDPKAEVDVSTTEIGEVFTDGPRLIDLGNDGKERPIGTSFAS